MARPTRIRDTGAIPEKRHDAFLLALFFAVLLNLTFFAVQALIPKIADLLNLISPPPIQQEEESYPFVLVDPSLFDEYVDPEVPPDAMSDRSREARQREAVDNLPEDTKPYEEEGVEELLTYPDGNPGPSEELSSQQTPAEAAQEQPAPEPAAAPAEAEDGPDTPEPPAMIPLEDIPDLPEITEITEPVEPAEPVEPDVAPPEEEALPDPLPDPALPEAPAAELPQQETPQPPEEPLVATEPQPEPVEVPQEVIPNPDASPDAELMDLASLAVSPDGFFDPRNRELEEALRQPPMAPPPPPPQWREPSPQPYQPHTMPPAMPQPTPPGVRERPRSSRGGTTNVPIVNAREAASASQAGGSPRQRNRANTVNVLDSDPNMRILASRYGEYMRKVARQLQQSLNRVVTMSPSDYSRGQAKIMFSIAADGSLAYHETQYPVDGSLEPVRIISETTLREAAPFEPPTREMLEDPLFRRMSLTVNLY